MTTPRLPARRLPADAGIAIGPILFVLALLGVLAAAMASSMGGFGEAGVADRIKNDVLSQANLIRTKINECNIRYGTNANGDGWPPSDPTNGTTVADVICEGDPSGAQNLWTGAHPTQLGPPTQGFPAWTYMNAGDAGGRCVWTAPASGNSSPGVVDGIKMVVAKFSSQEIDYQPASTSQKLVIFITRPTGTADAHCAAP